MNSHRSLFIVLEGIDASGTTTQAQRLVGYLHRKWHRRAIYTHEPSPGPVGMLIRLAIGGRLLGIHMDFNGHSEQLVEASAGSPLDSRTLALLYAADRYDHLHTTIEPALEQGRHVVCDRYFLSSLAYQGVDAPLDWVLQLNEGTRIPDLTIYLDLDPETAQLRMRQTRDKLDLYEDVEKQKRIRDNYRAAIEEYGAHIGRVEMVDASRTLGLVDKEVNRLVDGLLSNGENDLPQQQTMLDVG